MWQNIKKTQLIYSSVGFFKVFIVYLLPLSALFYTYQINTVIAQTGIITTMAGNGIIGFSGDGGPAIEAALNGPSGVFVDDFGNIFIADEHNHRIRKVDNATGIITTIAGSDESRVTGAFGGDGGLATDAALSFPKGVVLDSNGNIFIADFGNSRIRKVDGKTGIITTVAGNGFPGFSRDGGLATEASLDHPEGVSVDNLGNIYIADTLNFVIRKVDAKSGIITTVAGGSDDFDVLGDGGQAVEAALNEPSGVFADSSGNIFIADTRNQRIRKVDGKTGIITTIAGSGALGFAAGSFGGDGGRATEGSLNHPVDAFVDNFGNVFIADEGNHRIRRVDSESGIITTVAGNGSPGFSGDDGPAIEAALNQPEGVFVDIEGNVFIVDLFRIRMVSPIQDADPSSNAIGTDIGGPIASDTIFTEAESPFNVKVNLLVIEGVTLTIEPGVVLRFDEGTNLQVDGELIARGTGVKPITFTSSSSDSNLWQILFTEKAKTAIYDIQDNYVSGSIIEFCTFKKTTGVPIECKSNAPFINNCLIQDNDSAGITMIGIAKIVIANNSITGNGGSAIAIRLSIDVIISNNKITKNAERTFPDFGAVISTFNSENVIFSNNTVSENSSGGVSVLFPTNVIVTNNTVSKNSSAGIAVNSANDMIVSGNTITENNSMGMSVAGHGGTISGNKIHKNEEGGASVGSINGDKPIIVTRNDIRENEGGVGLQVSSNVVANENNILDNAEFEIGSNNNPGAENIDATNNWWGTTDILAIRLKTFDFFTDENLGIIDIEPVATGPFTIEEIPLATPSFTPRPTTSPATTTTPEPMPSATLQPSPTPTLSQPVPTVTPVQTPPPSGKSFTFNCEHNLKSARLSGLEKLTLKLGESENCTLRLTNHEPGKKVEISSLLRKGLMSSIKVVPARSVTDANGELAVIITAIRKGKDWAAWAVQNDRGLFKFNKKTYDAGLAWGMFVEVE